jgi:(S)-mandelate dehydrogenase
MRRLVGVADWQAAARARLPRFVYDYLAQGAEDGSCMRRNRAELDAIELWPRVLHATVEVDTSVELFGRRWPMPAAIAPTGLNGLIRPGGDLALARAADQAGSVFCMSTAANASMEQVRAAVAGVHLWLQLYVLSERALAEQMLSRARSAGVEALVLTVDVPVSGKREADLRNGFAVPLRPTLRLAADLICHPRWSIGQALGATLRMENLAPGNSAAPALQAALLSRGMDRSLDWAAVDWLRRLWDGPLLLKGILHADDARRAWQHGVDGVIVSNHGGRQLDAAPSSISALPAVVDAVGGRMAVLLDSGIRRGSDLARALALGASGVLLGRSALFGLAVAGEAGVSAVLRELAEEYQRTLILLGATSATSLREHIRPS